MTSLIAFLTLGFYLIHWGWQRLRVHAASVEKVWMLMKTMIYKRQDFSPPLFLSFFLSFYARKQALDFRGFNGLSAR
jgi:hypothetical protein